MRRAVLVNGVPASGKSTFAKALVRDLLESGYPAVPLTLDTVKEGLFEHLGTGDREHNRLLGRASYHAIFSTVAEFPDALIPVIDAWHGFQPVDVLRGHLARARVEHVIEVWVSVAPERAAARYRARANKRPEGHLPASYADELFELARHASPVGLGRVIEVDGALPYDPDLGARVVEAFQRCPGEAHGAKAADS